MPQKPQRSHKRDLIATSGGDCMQTPPYAVDLVLPYLRQDWVWWESACGPKRQIANVLINHGLQCFATDVRANPDCDFFTWEPGQATTSWDAQITNPPYSIKEKWIVRSFELGKPFALLVPIETLEINGKLRPLLIQHKPDISWIIPSRRVDFWTPGKGWAGSGAQMPTMWMTWGFGLDEEIIYVDLPLETKKAWKQQHLQSTSSYGMTPGNAEHARHNSTNIYER